MKKIKYLLIAVILFILTIDVHAINSKNTEIECVYANGVVIGMNYDKVADQNLVYVKNYPVSNSVEIDFETITNISIYNEKDALNNLSKLTCPSKVYYWIAGEKTANDNYSYRGIYNFSVYSGSGSEEIVTVLLNPSKNAWWQGGGQVANGTVVPINFKMDYNNSTGSDCTERYKPMTRTADDVMVMARCSNKNCTKGYQCDAHASFGLVAERLYFVDNISDSAYGHTYKLVDDDEQAVSNNKYIQVYRGSGNTFLQVGKIVTTTMDSSVMAKYVCIKESTTTQDSNRGESAYKFSSIRHSITGTSDKKINCGEGSKLYTRTTETCKITVGDNKDSFCDKYSNTAFVLIDIIQIMQILVPAVVIIFSGIEIGRIVLAGNIEEELPKRKKSLVIRLIVMVAFFFLPTIVQLIISLAEGVSILDVSCLFNDGQKVEQNQELNEENCVVEGDNSSSGGGSTNNPIGPSKPGNNVTESIK